MDQSDSSKQKGKGTGERAKNSRPKKSGKRAASKLKNQFEEDLDALLKRVLLTGEEDLPREGRFRDEQTQRGYEENITNEAATTRAEAPTSVWKEEGLPGEDALPDLIKALHSEDAKVRRETAMLLGSIGPGAMAAGPALFRIIHEDADALARDFADFALREIYRLVFVPIHAKHFNTYSEFVEATRNAGLEVDRSATEEAIKTFLDAFRAKGDEDISVHAEALSRLRKLGDAGLDLYAFYVDTNVKERAEIRSVLMDSDGKAIDIRLPIYKTASQFVSDLLRLNPVPERKPAPPTPPTPSEAERSEQLDALLATVPKDAPYEEQAPHAASLSHAFRQRLAEQIAPALNAHIQAMPHDTYEEKKELARWVNGELERFGLAVKCPKTGLPAKLRSQTGNWPGVGRFAVEVYVDGKQKTPTVSDKLPELTLTDATPPKEAEMSWQQAVGPKASRSGRKLS